MNSDIYSKYNLITNLSLPINSVGKDFIVGDIHGEYHLLIKAMKKINFRRDVDRIICTGDLIDRGPNSSSVLDLLNEDFFFSTIGNHEEMLLKYSSSKIKMEYYWYPNGGEWWKKLNVQSQQHYVTLIQNSMPVLITIQFDGFQIGIVHADFPLNLSWHAAMQKISNGGISLNNFLWRRTRIENKTSDVIEGVNHVLLGHTPLEHITTLGNCIFIDTGCGHSASNHIRNPSLTICEISRGEFKYYNFKK